MTEQRWPVVEIAPWDLSWHRDGTRGRTGVCSWGDDAREARWSGRWSNRTWAICDEHLPGFVQSVVGEGSGPDGGAE